MQSPLGLVVAKWGSKTLTIYRYVSHPMLTLFSCPFFSGCLKDKKNRYINKNRNQSPKSRLLLVTPNKETQMPLPKFYSAGSSSPSKCDWNSSLSWPSLTLIITIFRPFLFSPQEKAASSRSEQIQVTEVASFFETNTLSSFSYFYWS